MALEIALLAVFFALGLAAQRTPSAARARDATWALGWFVLGPVVVFYGFATIQVDQALLLAIVAAILAQWTVMGLSYAYAALVSRERDERGALALAAAFPNTVALGYPLAQLAFGNPGLALMAVYAHLHWLVPPAAVSTVIARLHGRRDPTGAARRRTAAVLVNPPLVGALAAVALRAADVDVAAAAELSASVAALVVGPLGFFQVGLSLPLDRLSYEPVELRRAAGAVAIRFAGAPLVLLVFGLALGAEIPGAFYLGAAMPCAFHLLVLARVFDVRPQLMRLLVVGSTVAAVGAVAAGAAIFG